MVVPNTIIAVLVFKVLVAMLFKILSSQKNDGNITDLKETTVYNRRRFSYRMLS